VTLEFSLPKVRYEKKVQNIVEHTNMDRKEVIVPKEVREDTKGKIEKDAEWRKKKQEEAEERKKQRDLN
jgi:hypothetical protein